MTGTALENYPIHMALREGAEVIIRTLGLDRLFFELVERREHDAIKAAVGTGFEEVGSLQGRVRDIYGSLQNLVILELPLDQDDLSMEY